MVVGSGGGSSITLLTVSSIEADSIATLVSGDSSAAKLTATSLLSDATGKDAKDCCNTLLAKTTSDLVSSKITI